MDTTAELYRPLHIGSAVIPGNILLAPLAGYTDKAFRELCYGYGADLCYSEMVSAEAVARANAKSLALMERGDGERRLAIQLFLSEPDQAVRALPAVLSYRPDIIDINCGCPVPKVTKTGAGAALMRDPARLSRIVEALTSRTDIPVTVKIRTGWDSGSLSYLETARAAVEAGAAAVAMHARTRAQVYSGTADWSHIARLAESVSVPVIGSGDLFSPEAVREMLLRTRCAGVMCARGAIGNPFLFAAVRAALGADIRGAGQGTQGTQGLRDLQDPPAAEPSARSRLQTAIRHYHRAVRYRGEHSAVKEMKKHLAAYTKGLPGGSSLRDSLMRCTDGECYRRVFDAYLEQLEQSS